MKLSFNWIYYFFPNIYAKILQHKIALLPYTCINKCFVKFRLWKIYLKYINVHIKAQTYSLKLNHNENNSWKKYKYSIKSKINQIMEKTFVLNQYFMFLSENGISDLMSLIFASLIWTSMHLDSISIEQKCRILFYYMEWYWDSQIPYMSNNSPIWVFYYAVLLWISI